MYKGVRMELGKRANPQDIIEMYNELVEEGSTLVDYSEYGTEGMFYNEEGDEIPVDVILDELNYAIVGEEEDEDYDDKFDKESQEIKRIERELGNINDEDEDY
jgi:vacuolar-type H+-ATPase subunit I/STV1